MAAAPMDRSPDPLVQVVPGDLRREFETRDRARERQPAQLMTNVSTVPSVRQLMAFATDLVCDSAP